MEPEHREKNELDSLWERLENLKRLESELPASGTIVSAPNPEQLKTEIVNRLGYIPPLFGPALEFPVLLECLWHQQLSSYYDNPLPELFKEKLSTRLSRFSISSYFIVVHACMLHRLGMPAREVRQLVEKPAPTPIDIERAREMLARIPHPVETWPADDPAFEDSLIACCAAIFLRLAESDRCSVELKDVLGSSNYAYLIALLANTKASHLWMETHPEIGYEAHPVVQNSFPALVRDEPHLLPLFRNHSDVAGQNLLKSDRKDGIAESEERYRELFENASDIIYTHDFEGKLISINRAIERIAGYTRAEALQMKITDFVVPEYSQQGQKMIDPQIAGEIPLNFELEIFSKERNRIALGISTRPMFRGGKAFAVQGIARDITRSKQTEAELQEANQKLEAWVSELEQRTREMTMLNEMGDILRACLSTEEAYNVIVRVAQQIFPAKVGALYVIAPSRNLVEAVAVWGDPALAERAFRVIIHKS